MDAAEPQEAATTSKLEELHRIEQKITRLVATAAKAIEATSTDPLPNEADFQWHTQAYYQLLSEIHAGITDQLALNYISSVPYLTTPYLQEQEMVVAATDVAIARDLVAEALQVAESALNKTTTANGSASDDAAAATSGLVNGSTTVDEMDR